MEDATEDHYAELFAKLEAQRCALEDKEGMEADYFKTSLLGGAWQVKRTGPAVYGVRVDAKAGSPVAELCTTYGLPKSASFEQNVYGELHGNKLAKLWEHRMTFLTNLWVQAGRPAEQFPAEGLSTYEVPAELMACLAGLEGRGRKRADAIKKLAPAVAAR